MMLHDVEWRMSTAAKKSWFEDTMDFARKQGEVPQDGDDVIVLTFDDNDLVAVRFYEEDPS